MKRRSREINVFSISALDLFASALGAFILMSLIFMVFFAMTAKGSAQAEEAAEALAACKAHVAELQSMLAESVDASELQDCQSRVAQLEGALAECRMQAANAGELADQLERAEQALESANQQLEGNEQALERANQQLGECRRALERTFVLVVASWSSSQDVDLHVVDPQGREFYYANRRSSGSQAALEEDNTRGPGNELWLHPSANPGRYRVCYKLYSGAPAVAVRGSLLWQEGRIGLPGIELTQASQVRLAAEVLVDDSGRVTLDTARSGQVLGGSGCR